jgi:CRISPR-associated protein Csb2
MAALAIIWDYLTGYSVAAVANRDRAEWPPHPARVFMALAAAWFETEPPESDAAGKMSWNAEGEALRWLETLGDPELLLPPVEPDSERSGATCYVPVNDKAGPAAATLLSCPSITRSKQPRTFPKLWVGDGSCALCWPNADDAATHRAALDRLCRKVTRIGHPSSLVSMSVADDTDPTPESAVHLVPDALGTGGQLRSIAHGTVDMLRERFGEDARRQHSELGRQIDELKDQKRMVKGKGAKGRKDEIDQQVRQLETDRAAISPRPPVRPVVAITAGYRRAIRGAPAGEAPGSLFDPDLLVLAHGDGPKPPLVATLAVTRVLRDAIMSTGPQPVPDWVSGHGPAGQPDRDPSGHLAVIPLPFVGREHAGGHLLGVGLVFPRTISREDRGRALGPLLVDEVGKAKDVSLKLGALGVWVVRKRDWQEQHKTLEPRRWTAAGEYADTPSGALIWASVTPVVLDRFPKADRHNPAERADWEAEVAETVSKACVRIQLPEPELIDIDTTSWHLGSPRSIRRAQPVRGQTAGAIGGDVARGDGFPPYPAKGTGASRPQVHVWIRFKQPVVGPVILGAGRYLGYGLCRPLLGGQL